MRYEARVEIAHRPGILDPQGGVIERALPALGYGNVTDVRVGKSIRLVVSADDQAAARTQVDEMCRKLLANPVIEDFAVELRELPPPGGSGVSPGEPGGSGVSPGEPGGSGVSPGEPGR